MSELEIMVLVDGTLIELGEPSVKSYELQIQFGLPGQYPPQDLPVKDFLEALLNAGTDIVHDRIALNGADRIRKRGRQWNALADRLVKIVFHAVQNYVGLLQRRSARH